MRQESGLIVLLVLLAVTLNAVEARQFRQLRAIPTPNKTTMALPDGAVPMEDTADLDRDQVKAAVNHVLSTWNTGNMESALSDQFHDKSRLTDAVDIIVPRDATLRLQSVQGVQTLQQYMMPSDEGNSIVSIVSATVRTQLEYNDPAAGLVRRQGVNEFILKVKQPAQ